MACQLCAAECAKLVIEHPGSIPTAGQLPRLILPKRRTERVYPRAVKVKMSG